MTYICIMGSILGLLTSVYTLKIHSIKKQSSSILEKQKYLYAIGITSILTVSILFLYNRYGLTNQFIAMSFITWLLMSMSVHDIRYREVPMDALILGGVIGVCMVILNPNLVWQDALIGCIAVGGSLVALSRITRGALGMGDAFVISVVGLVLGYKMAIAILLYGLVISGVVGLILLTFRVVNRKTRLPLVPFLLMAYMLLMVI
ncbi:prepilin peptidase [Vallitalea pronyensis]|uniref:Prepilin peptidase n=1 Tax=Vallitalea pronyensis TaxID=1348613 RepID=A0A8J8MNT3_9FIRM|nr:A24 family peptidase [Vallitalea pronyensis]QUI24618.1 prepilin peptidase [Vallitalea pronyensis]